MKKFAFVDASGSPTYVACPSVDDAHQEGEVLNGLVCREVPYETDDVAVLSTMCWTDEGWADRPLRPSNHHQWDSAAFVWVDGRSLSDLKAVKNEEINTARLTANRTSFPFMGKDIACDELSRSDIEGTNGCVLLTGDFPQGWPGGWKTIDNTYVPIVTVEDWKALYSAMTTQGMANFAKAQALKAQIEQAQTPEDVQAIQWA